MRRLLVLTLLFHACDRAEPTTTPDEVDRDSGAESVQDVEDADTDGEPAEAEPAEATEPAPATPPEPTDPYGPLAQEAADRFAAITPDPEPTELTRNSHYWVSNERSQFLWYPLIKDVGGAYIGVGTDQNYMLAGWAHSDMIVLMDFDQAIVNLHKVYEVLFAAADTPEKFLELWNEDQEPSVRAMLEEAYTDPDERKHVLRAHKIARKLVRSRLRRLVRQYPPLGIPTFVTDQEQYDHIRTLSANGRVVMMRGDLTATSALRGIGEALTANAMKLGLLYLSNAEQYFDYLPDFRRNILSLPFADNGQVLRTLGWEFHGFVDGEEYHYNTQPGTNFASWMKLNRVKRAGRILRKKEATDIPGSSILVKEPEVSDPPPEIAP